MTPPPNRYVQPEVNEARVERLWQNVSERLDSRPSHAFRWVLLCVALAGAAAGVFFWRASHSFGPGSGGSERAVLADAKLETKSDELAVTLGDGSSVKLAPESELTVRGSRSSSISLALSRGELSCDVTHREERKFSVVAGDVEVRVVGTKFSVKRTPGQAPRVEVNVTRGVVEVVSARRPGVVARVAAGQTWSQNAETALDEHNLPASATQPIPRVVDALKREPAAPSPGAFSARDLFERAGESRRAGDAAAAARAYEELLRAHPGDARASLAAFELGRLRMDRLGDLPGAITALERAVAMQIGPSFREDALARLVTANAAQGNLAGCRRAQERYLSSYPAGVHAAAVATRCGSR